MSFNMKWYEMNSSDLLWTPTSLALGVSAIPLVQPVGWLTRFFVRGAKPCIWHLALWFWWFQLDDGLTLLQTDISTSCRWSVEDKLPFKAASSVDRLDTLYISCSDILLEHCLNNCAAFLLHVVSATHRKRAFIRIPDVPQNWEFHHLLEQIDFFQCEQYDLWLILYQLGYVENLLNNYI